MCGRGGHMGNLCIFSPFGYETETVKKKGKVLIQDTQEQK